MPVETINPGDLISLCDAIKKEIPGKPAYSTVWRWVVRGLTPVNPGEPRIKLNVKYVGSKPFTTRAAICDFIERATQARIAKAERTQRRADDVSDEELASVGLMAAAK